MGLGWVWGKVLHVDLSSDRVWEEKLESRVYKLLLGGRGLAVLLLYRSLKGGEVDPLSPKNPLIISPGFMVGSGLPTASKSFFASRSPLTSFLGRSAVGAWLGWELRRASYDALVVTGALEEPGVLVVDHDGVRVERAGRLWGLRVGEARAELSRRYPGYSACVIGPAGERLSLISVVDCNGRQAGRTGMGAVMGSKKLKAIAVKGYMEPEPAEPREARRIAARWAREILRHPASKSVIEYGTPAMVGLTAGKHGVFPSLNWRKSTLKWCGDERRAVENLGYWAPRMRVGRNPCPFCNRVCSQVVEVEVPGEGRVRVDGPEYETVYALGSNLGFCTVEPVAVLAHLAD
jgi:aldehyde:ferredoxin oxidoreductase